MYRFIGFLCLMLIVRFLIFYLYSPHVQIIRKDPIRETTIFAQIKDHIRHVYSENLNAHDSTLLMGIVFGDKKLDKSSMKNFQTTGVLHIIAASGMNLTILTGFLLGTLTAFIKRRHALIITGAMVIFYSALADFQPSIVRAAVMALIAIGAGLFGRQNTTLLALFLAAFAMVFWDPTVISSISFILSFAATLGIILFDPIFKRGIFKGSFFEDFRTTTSAQIATTPILLFFFGTYSPISILTNFLILWTVAPLTILGGVAAFFSFIPFLSKPFLLICIPLLTYFWAVINLFAKFASPIKLESPPWTIIVGYYLILGGVIKILYKNNPISK